ncbi:hypothetical protein V7014_03955 [Bacillus sp. JJ722]
MDQSILKGTHFTEHQKILVRKALISKKKRKQLLPTILTCTIIGLFLLFTTNLITYQILEKQQNNSSSPKKDTNERERETAKSINLNSSSWALSPPFTITKPNEDGKPTPYGLRGVKGKIAIVDAPVYTNQYNKQLVHIWGANVKETQTFINKKIKIKATKKGDSNSTVTAFEGILTIPSDAMININMSKNNSDYTPLTYVESVGYLQLPAPGIWKLDVFIEGEFFEKIIIEVL